MKIGKLKLDTNIFLAPLAGYTDLPFRRMCEDYGCKLTYTEMINAKGLTIGDKNTIKMLETDGQKESVGVQIFGRDPDTMGQAAEILTSMDKFQIIDINMGCPVPKVVKNGEGSALMKEPETAIKIVKKVVANTNLPVTVKIRKGWDKKSVNAVQFAKKMEDSGASAITVHGRLREEFFAGKVDQEIIKKVKENIKIPVIGNGDIFSAKDMENMIEYTGCDGVMVGRGAVGNPFIFSKEEVDNKEKISVLIKHYHLAMEILGEKKACLDMRKHINAYLRGIPNSANVKKTLNTIQEPEKVLEILEKFKLLTN